MSRQSPSSQSSDATLPLLPHRERVPRKLRPALLIGGSREMPALGLAGMATLRSGAGLVQLAARSRSSPVMSPAT